jgi:O-antigen/teichoic acid export membrane protein
MGVIRRQGIKHSIVNYFGVLIGAFSTFYIYQLSDVTWDFYGLAQGIVGMAMLLLPFATLGITTLIIRFFPDFEEKNNHHNGFLSFLLIAITASMLIFFLSVWLFSDQLLSGLENLKFDTEPFRKHGFAVIILCTIIAYSAVFDNFAKNFQRITVQAVFTYLLPKIALPTLILFLHWGYLDEIESAIGLSAFYLLGMIGLIGYLIYLGQLNLRPKFSFLTKERLSSMGGYALYGILGSLGSMLALRIDSIMVLSLIGETTNAAYNNAYFMANVIAIPGTSVIAIASPIIAQSIAKSDMANVANIYKKSSLTLGAIGLGIYLLIGISIDELFGLMPKGDAASIGKWVFFLIGASKVIDLLTSVNGQIISYSKYFRFSLVAICLLAVLNVFLNYFFIKTLDLDLNGAALATLVSLTLYNIIKLLFIYIKLHIQPFTKNTLVLFLIFGAVFLLAQWIPGFGISGIPEKLNYFLTVVLKSVICGSLFLAALLWTRTAPEINQAFMHYWGLLQDWRKSK